MAKKPISLISQAALKDLTIEELQFLGILAKRKDIEVLYKMILGEAERNKNVIYRLPEVDPIKLAIEKAALRGGVEALYRFVEMIKSATTEIDRRLGDKNG